MVIGADQLIKFKLWKRYKSIINSVHIIGFNRKKYEFTPLDGMNFKWAQNFNVDISSKEIREKISNGEAIGNRLTYPILNYIEENNLYGYTQ